MKRVLTIAYILLFYQVVAFTQIKVTDLLRLKESSEVEILKLLLEKKYSVSVIYRDSSNSSGSEIKICTLRTKDFDIEYHFLEDSPYGIRYLSVKLKKGSTTELSFLTELSTSFKKVYYSEELDYGFSCTKFSNKENRRVVLFKSSSMNLTELLLVDCFRIENL